MYQKRQPFEKEKVILHPSYKIDNDNERIVDKKNHELHDLNLLRGGL